MSFLRPEVQRFLTRWREVLTGFAACGVGLWLAGLGGPVFLTLGAVVSVAALALTVIAWRRTRFRLEVDAPGVVEVDESRISYMGPLMGGSVSLAELVEIDVIDVASTRRCWRLRQADGQALLVPLAAAGADRLYDHFAALPGAEARALLSALEEGSATGRTVWRRPAPPGAVSSR